MAVQLDQFEQPRNASPPRTTWSSSTSSSRAAPSSAPCASSSKRTPRNEPNWLSKPQPERSDLPKGVPVEMLSGVTHEDCATFAQDFGTVLDVEDLIPGAEYTLEVSSPGLERKLFRPEDYTRFQGSLIKLQTFTPVNKNRQWQGRLTKFQTAYSRSTSLPSSRRAKQKGRDRARPSTSPWRTSKRPIWSRKFRNRQQDSDS